MLGLGAVIEGCGLQMDEVEKMPRTELTDLVKNPEAMAGKAIKTEGYITPLGVRQYKKLVGHKREIGKIDLGNSISVPLTVTDYDWEKTARVSYQLSQQPGDPSVSFIVTSDGPMKVQTGAVEIDPNHKITVVGNIETLKDASGGKVQVLSFRLAFDMSAPEAVPSQN